jgi:DNA-binding CsgD family transcriptional regulator
VTKARDFYCLIRSDLNEEIALKRRIRTTAGIRTNCFSNTVLFLKEVLKLESTHYDPEREFVQFKLPSGEILEIFGSKNLWHPFTAVPGWEVMIADVRQRNEKIAPEVQVAPVTKMLPRTRPGYPAGLTRREVEVLRLVAQGLTNFNVAAHLVISPRTVNTHLNSIYRKLNTSSREVAIRFALEHGLEKWCSAGHENRSEKYVPI